MRAYVYQLVTLVLAAVAFGLAIAVQIALPQQIAELDQTHVTEQPELMGSVAPNYAARIASLSQSTTPDPIILLRPLFTATRVPFVAPEPPKVVSEEVPAVIPTPPESPPTATADPSTLVLKGTVFDGRSSTALILNSSDQSTNWYEIGATVGGWEVSEIAANDVMLSHAGQSFRLQQYVDNSQPPLAREKLQQ